MENIWIVLIALALDALLGELPNRLHPVAWLGSFINWQLKFMPPENARNQFIFGLLVVLFTIVIITVPILLLPHYLGQLNAVANIIMATLILKSTFAVRGLWQAVDQVKNRLKSRDIVSARNSVKSLVSRDTANLDEKQVVSATIESCAENICDSFIAPLFYFIIFGVAGAVAYRIINTFDAMIGYHGKWEYTGKFAARLDDVVNYIPARLSGALLTLAAVITRNKAGGAWLTMLRERNNTESPNAGWSMAAMAGSLGVMLEKEGHYRLGTNTREAAIDDISKSQLILLVSAALWSFTVIFVEVVKVVATQAIY